MENLYQVIYASFLAPEHDEAALRDIVALARAKNRPLGITGLLLFDGLRICQYLEGPNAPLYALVDAVRIDPRHFAFDIKEHRHTAGARRFRDHPLALAICDRPEDLDRFHELNRHAGPSAFALLDLLAPTLAIET